MLFDIDNLRIGMAESSCDYELATTGKIDAELADPYISYHKIVNLYRESFFRNKCQDNKIMCWLFTLLNNAPMYLFIMLMVTFLLDIKTRYKSFSSRLEGLAVKLSRSESTEGEWKYSKLQMKNSEENNNC